MKVYLMQRTGQFIPENLSYNQCRKAGITDYTYNVQLVLVPTLNKKGFCIDHDRIDKAIQKAEIQGSCEEMQKQIYKAVSKACKKEGVKFLAYSCHILPTPPEGFIGFLPASIRYYRGKNKYVKLLD